MVWPEVGGIQVFIEQEEACVKQVLAEQGMSAWIGDGTAQRRNALLSWGHRAILITCLEAASLGQEVRSSTLHISG